MIFYKSHLEFNTSFILIFSKYFPKALIKAICNPLLPSKNPFFNKKCFENFNITDIKLFNKEIFLVPFLT